jgi:signal transduction histidine kinase
MYGGRQAAGYVASDGSVWFATSRGAAHVVSFGAPASQLSLHIESVAADMQQLPVRSPLHLNADLSRLNFSFTPLLLSSQQGLRFRYLMQGFDQGWSPATATRSATYTNLPAGRYRFRVQVLDLADPSASAEAEITLIKSPHIYQRWWFLGLLLLCVAGLIWSSHRFRLRQVRARFRAVLDERNRLAREMHDTVIQGCASTSALLEALASVQPETQSTAHELLSYARTQIRTTIDEARDAVWDLRHNHRSRIDLAEGLHSVAQQAERAFHVKVRCDLSRNLEPVPASAGHELLMVVREVLANAGLHAQAHEVQVRASVSSSALQIEIVDDGVGFDTEKAAGPNQGHFGLTGIRERMVHLGGAVKVHSVHGSGTQVAIALPLKVLHRNREETIA